MGAMPKTRTNDFPDDRRNDPDFDRVLSGIVETEWAVRWVLREHRKGLELLGEAVHG